MWHDANSHIYPCALHILSMVHSHLTKAILSLLNLRSHRVNVPFPEICVEVNMASTKVTTID